MARHPAHLGMALGRGCSLSFMPHLNLSLSLCENSSGVSTFCTHMEGQLHAFVPGGFLCPLPPCLPHTPPSLSINKCNQLIHIYVINLACTLPPIPFHIFEIPKEKRASIHHTIPFLEASISYTRQEREGKGQDKDACLPSFLSGFGTGWITSCILSAFMLLLLGMLLPACRLPFPQLCLLLPPNFAALHPSFSACTVLLVPFCKTQSMQTHAQLNCCLLPALLHACLAALCCLGTCLPKPWFDPNAQHFPMLCSCPARHACHAACIDSSAPSPSLPTPSMCLNPQPFALHSIFMCCMVGQGHALCNIKP